LHLGAGPIMLGFLISLSPLLPLFLAIHAGRLTDQIGNKIPLVLGTMGTGLGLFIPFMFKSLPALFFSQLLVGASNLFFHVAIQNFIGSIGNAESRAKNFSLFSITAAVSGILAPLLVGFSIDYLNFPITYLFLSFFSIVPSLLFLFLPSIFSETMKKEKVEKKKHNFTTSNVKDLLSIPSLRRVLLSSGMILTGIGLFTFYIPIYGNSIGLSATIIGMIISVYSIAFFIVRIVMPYAVKKTSEEFVLTASMAIATVPFILLPFVENPFILFVLSFLIGVGLGTGQPLSIILTYNYSPMGRTGEALGVRLTVNKFTQVTIPILFGLIGSSFGFFPVFFSNAILLVIGVVIHYQKGMFCKGLIKKQ
jgi:MFS family permease